MSGSTVRDAGLDRLGPPGAGTLGAVAGRALIAGAVVSAAGVVFLVGMFVSFAVGASSTGLVLGRTNDVLVLVGYVLVAPSVIALRVILRPVTGRSGDLVALVGLAAIGAIAVLQTLLVAGTLTFEDQVGPVSLAMLVLGGWFVLVGRIGSASGVLPRGARMGLLAATYVGLPLWALWLGRRLLADDGGVAEDQRDAG